MTHSAQVDHAPQLPPAMVVVLADDLSAVATEGLVDLVDVIAGAAVLPEAMPRVRLAPKWPVAHVAQRLIGVDPSDAASQAMKVPSLRASGERDLRGFQADWASWRTAIVAERPMIRAGAATRHGRHLSSDGAYIPSLTGPFTINRAAHLSYAGVSCQDGGGANRRKACAIASTRATKPTDSAKWNPSVRDAMPRRTQCHWAVP